MRRATSSIDQFSSLAAIPKRPTLFTQRPGRGILRSSQARRSEKFFVANLATAAATHSSRQDGGNTIAEESPTRSLLEPLIGRTRG
jgi:hypothetical protein